MAYTIDEVLNEPLITVEDRNDETGSFAIKVGELSTTVFIELGRFRTSDTTKFEVSHAIHTPLQAGPYRTSIPFTEGGWEYALSRAVHGLTDYYRQAVEAGHKPDERWLVER